MKTRPLPLNSHETVSWECHPSQGGKPDDSETNRIALGEHVSQLDRWNGANAPDVHDVRRRMSAPIRE